MSENISYISDNVKTELVMRKQQAACTARRAARYGGVFPKAFMEPGHSAVGTAGGLWWRRIMDAWG
jgi:hypothetical protein